MSIYNTAISLTELIEELADGEYVCEQVDKKEWRVWREGKVSKPLPLITIDAIFFATFEKIYVRDFGTRLVFQCSFFIKKLKLERKTKKCAIL